MPFIIDNAILNLESWLRIAILRSTTKFKNRFVSQDIPHKIEMQLKILLNKKVTVESRSLHYFYNIHGILYHMQW